MIHVCSECDRPLSYSTREGWVCEVHGVQEVETYPEDTATPALFEVGE